MKEIETTLVIPETRAEQLTHAQEIADAIAHELSFAGKETFDDDALNDLIRDAGDLKGMLESAKGLPPENHSLLAVK